MCFMEEDPVKCEVCGKLMSIDRYQDHPYGKAKERPPCDDCEKVIQLAREQRDYQIANRKKL